MVDQDGEPDVLHGPAEAIDETTLRCRIAVEVRHVADYWLETVVEYIIGTFDERILEIVEVVLYYRDL
ncbi:hypothetical protein NWFMUON74_57080 [Nocardia wallacei]|uniref:Uncharacterized protein n=1 Tax=Nocardia wallacei TaxID=480035 RepID=A0A7G1KTM8_9NOCA|nr:hypothetical protein NWFMUON74_57080 [Nocardia wallacei]